MMRTVTHEGVGHCWEPPSGSGTATLRKPAELELSGHGVELIHNALVGVEGHFRCLSVVRC